MSLNIYSKESVDSLLNAKIGDAPSDGNQYVRKNAAWAILSGGGGGGVWGTITGSITDQTDLISYFGNYLPLTGGTLSGPVYSNSIFSTSYLSTYTQVAPSGLTAYDGTNTTIVQGSGVVFSDSTIQTTAAVTFTGGSITSSIYWNDGTVSTSMNDGYFLVQDSASSAYGVLYQNGMEVGDGTNTLYVHGTGITFADSTTQSTAVDGSLYLLLSGGAMTGALQLGGDLACDGYNLSGGNFSSPAGQVNCQNLTLTAGDGGVITFPDGSIQTTAPAGGMDYNAATYAGICAQLTFLAGSIPSTSAPFQFSLYASMNPNVNYYTMMGIGTSGNFGVTQDGVNFYPFDSVPSTSPWVFQASTFSLDTSNYLYLAFKDSYGAWHLAPNCIIFSP